MNWNAVPDDIPDKRLARSARGSRRKHRPGLPAPQAGEWPWLGVANVWYLKRATDHWEQERKPEAYFRLLTPDFRPLLACNVGDRSPPDRRSLAVAFIRKIIGH
ncbi:hypothetical protein [Candidatus Amarobacter glycogenicus]|uniref:hypothetical protein n=1 Tax=Candidatus Amarobacter glycogenicus TaxID=3140699 RepID=UPI0031CC9EB2